MFKVITKMCVLIVDIVLIFGVDCCCVAVSSVTETACSAGELFNNTEGKEFKIASGSP